MIRRLVAAIGFIVAAVLIAGPGHAADGEATIAHADSDGERLRVVVDVPPGSSPDLDGVTASLDGVPLDVTATPAGEEGEVQRTAVLAIDTSNSMRRNGRFAAAQRAALTYLDVVPDDVEVGIVTFDSDVEVALEPTSDREAARAVVGGLGLSRDTLLYDGVATAVDLAGDAGSRSLLVLSDGADTGSSVGLDELTERIGDADVVLDVVSLGQQGEARAALEAMATAGDGQVLPATERSLTLAFRKEAVRLRGQVQVTAPLPAGFDASTAQVTVTLPTDGEDLVASTLAPIQQVDDAGTVPQAEAGDPTGGWVAPRWVLVAGVTTVGTALLLVGILLIPGRPAPASVADRVAAYTSGRQAPTGRTAPEEPRESVLAPVRAAAAGLLARNRGLDERLSRRLTSAGSGFKASEWIVLQAGCAVLGALIGLLVGQGNLLVGIVFLVLGLLAPAGYLQLRTERRRRAFETNLPEVLQILSSALAAGLSLPQAVDTVVREGPEPIASEFKRVLVENRIGLSLEDAFDGVAERFDSSDFAWVVMAIRIQRQVGGNLAELLVTVAGTMRERQYLRRQVQTLSAEGRMSAIILCSLPPLFALFLLVTNPDYLAPLVSDARGLILLVGSVVWLTLGVLWMSRLIKVEV
ncbi:type II secretion system F family protein [Nocardioides sambongensis]|uniref:type II secretion system F family protein n=1 Tax=Nocardioides sambongensis TaxID=2589074 RepID=UPI001126452E|nr:type II secretion system F family protein [Nocardioides sambongensis]